MINLSVYYNYEILSNHPKVIRKASIYKEINVGKDTSKFNWIISKLIHESHESMTFGVRHTFNV